MNQTLEEVARAQEQVEDFACLAYDVRAATQLLVEAFNRLNRLADWPGQLDDSVSRLAALTLYIDGLATAWARVGNCDFQSSW